MRPETYAKIPARYRHKIRYGGLTTDEVLEVADAISGDPADAAIDSTARTAAAAAVADGLNAYSLSARDGVRSSARALTAYSQAVSIVENWSNLSNWTLASANSLAASGGKLIAGSSPSGGSCGNRAFALAANETARVVVALHYVSGLSDGLGVGLSTDAPGAAPGWGMTTINGIVFLANQVKSILNGTQTYIRSELPTGDYIVTITVDLSWVSVVLTGASMTDEVQMRFPRFTVGNIGVFCNDSRLGSGSTIGTIAARKGLASLTPRTNVEGIAPTVSWGGDGTTSWQIALPAAYDSRYRSPLVILFHGNGGNETSFAASGNGKLTRDAFLAAGYAVLTANNNAQGWGNWGASPGLDSYVSAYRFCRDNYNVGPVILCANSMGGIDSLNILANKRIPVAAWIGTVPAVSLASAYANPAYTAIIDAAYSGGSRIGHDPALMPASTFGGVPMLAVIATDDTSIPPATNWTPFAAALGDYPLEVITLTTTGGHGAALSGFTAAITAFADKFKT